MKRVPLFALALVAALTGCQSATSTQNNHWHVDSIGPRVAYHAFGYRSDEGSYLDRLRADRRALSVTLQRHILSDNPYNPLLPQPRTPPYQPAPPDVEFKVNADRATRGR